VDLIALALPVFLLLIGTEYVVGRRRGRRVFRHHDFIADIALGALQIIVTVVGAAALAGLYLVVFQQRLFTLPETWWVAVAAFVGVDFLYYWFHRASHRVMLLWAAHAPHHSSEDFNFAVALRQGPLQPLVSQLFYLPLAVVGVPYPLFVTMATVSLLYQFFIHTEQVRTLGPLELVLNTPAHHRVHHGCNAAYIDKNHGGIFIVWDRLFGTFANETTPAVYGTVTPAQTWNPLRAVWLPFADIVAKWRYADSIVDIVRAVFGPPEWLPARMPHGPLVDEQRARFSGGTSRLWWPTLQFVVVLAGSVAYLVGGRHLPASLQVAAAVWLTWSYGSIGGLLDERPWATASEVARLVVLAAGVVAIAGDAVVRGAS
jgi:alkylglycerol monooxygenase